MPPSRGTTTKWKLVEKQQILIQKNLRSFITVKAVCSMTDLNSKNHLVSSIVLHWTTDVIQVNQWPNGGLEETKCFSLFKDPFLVTQLNSTQLTQLNSVQPISAKQVSRVFCLWRRWPTNWVNWVTTFIDRWQLFTLWTCRQLDVELSWVVSL